MEKSPFFYRIEYNVQIMFSKNTMNTDFLQSPQSKNTKYLDLEVKNTILGGHMFEERSVKNLYCTS